MMQVGDFLAVAVLTTQIVKALSASKGSKFEFTSLTTTLKALSQAMLQAEAVAIEFNTSFDPDFCENSQLQARISIIAKDILREKDECKRLIDSFMRDYGSYTKAFIETKNKLRSNIRKLTWAMCKDEVASFEKRLQSHLQALQMSLNAYYCAAIKSDLASGVGMLIDKFDAVHFKMSETVAKLATAHADMPKPMGYCWGPDPPIIILDALGRQMCFPLILASSPDTFRDVLLITHRDCPGYDRIQSGKYVVSDEDAGGALVPRDRWLESFRPGRHVAVSFLLKHPGLGYEEQCPRCRSSKTRQLRHLGQRTCLRCQLEFTFESRDRIQMFWSNRNPRPKLVKHKSAPEIPPRAEELASETERQSPTGRSATLPPEQYRHPYSRVHYQRDVFRRASVDHSWNKTDPELARFLAALPPIHSAAATGNIEKLDELLESQENPDVNWKVTDSLYRYDRGGWDWTGAPPLHFAAYFGHNGAVRFLLRCGADVDGCDAAGTTALHAAAWTGNEELFQMLLHRGADATIHDSDGWSTLIYALIQGHENIVRLISTGATKQSNSRELYDEETLIKSLVVRREAKLGNSAAVMTALPPVSPDEHALEDILEAETREMVLTSGLVGAAEGGHGDLVEKLLEQGADPLSRDIAGSTALHWAVWGAHAEAENLRYDAERRAEDGDEDDGGVVDDSDDDGESCDQEKGEDSSSGGGDGDGDGNGASAHRIHSRSLRHELVIRLLVDRGVDVNLQNAQGATALHWAAGSGSISVIQFLLDMGADANLADQDGRSSIDRAVETGDEKVIGRLLRSTGGANG